MRSQGNTPMVPRHVHRETTEQGQAESSNHPAAMAAGWTPPSPDWDSLNALQDLVAALDPLAGDPLADTKTESSADQVEADDLPAQLVIAAASGTRREAVKAVVQQLSKLFPECSIQAGIGGQQLRHFLDATVGWTGAESALFRDFAHAWRTFHGVSPPTPPETSASETSDSANVAPPHHQPPKTSCATLIDGDVWVCLVRPRSLGDSGDHCILIRLANNDDASPIAQSLARCVPSLAAVLWNRPAWALPQAFYLRGNRLMIALMVVGCLLLLAAFPVPYRVQASVRIEPQSPRVVSAPFEALIEDVKVHPGDFVKAGQTLLILDGRPLRLERQSLDAEIYQSAKQKDIALAAGRVAEAQQAQLKFQQLMRRRDLIDRRLDQLTIVSPIDGVVVTGDLRRSIGASLELGRALMEIAPLERVLVEIAIPEYEICMVDQRSQARIRVDASGTPTIQETIAEIYPAGELRDDKVVFISLIELDNSTGAFRPGMTGKATVYGDYRPLIWPYVRRAIDQVTWLVGL